MTNHLMNTYMRQPVTFVKGEGVWLWDDKGEKYLDALAGVAVNGLGHAHPKLVRAISEQAAKLIHVSNIYQIAEQAALADKLCEISGMDKVFFCNSGCEANEASIKLLQHNLHLVLQIFHQVQHNLDSGALRWRQWGVGRPLSPPI